MVNGYAPETLAEALALRAKETLVPYAGGTELMVQEHPAGPFLFLHKIPELRGIADAGGAVRMGAACTYAELLESPLVPELLKLAAGQVAAPGIRSIATMGGNVCNASPAGDTLPVLYLCNAAVNLASLDGAGAVQWRKLPISAFILGVRKVDLAPNELLVSIEMEKPAFTRAVFEKIGARKAQAISKLSFAGAATTQNGKLADFRAAFGAVGVTVVRRPELEAQVLQCGTAATAAKEAIKLYAQAINPIDDQRSTAAYRKQVCLNLLGDFLGGLENEC